MSRLQEDAKKGAAKNREPHADVLKTGRAQMASTGSRARRQERAPKGTAAWHGRQNSTPQGR